MSSRSIHAVMLAISLVLGALAAGCRASVVTGPPARDIDEFAARLEAIRAASRIPGVSVVIAKDQQIVWARGFGVADVVTQAPVTPATSFHLASLTKPFAAALIMQLVEQGLVSLDDPVTKYGIQLQSSGVIRVRHLMSHTSEGTPGREFHYNGNRFGELDSVIVRASGKSFARMLQDNILGPLHLQRTAPNNLSPANFAVTEMDRSAFTSNLARGYTITNDLPVATAYPSYFGTAAGLIASASDVATFSMAMDRDMFVLPSTKAMMFTPAISTTGEALPYGLGWFVTRSGGPTIVWHYGLWTAISALIVKVPERGLTFVVLANTSGLSEPYDIVGDIRNSPWAREFLDAFINGTASLPTP